MVHQSKHEQLGCNANRGAGPLVRLLRDGRNVELVEPLYFNDAAGEAWSVPVGAIVNGASIPRLFWRVIGPPLTGKYRDASILHDYYCDVKSVPSPQVHAMFFEKMIYDEVHPVQAWLMWLAVRTFGPRF